ncbi:MAG: Mth938-like domain-containing protein [Bosea sp. (in: a-proteobacteria)]
MADGLPFVERPAGFVPGRHLIDSYGAGGFRFAEMSHKGSILALPSGVQAWPVTKVAEITADVLAPVVQEADEVDFLIIGTGADIAFIPKALREELKAVGIVIEGMATPAAARTYNVLVGEGRRVAAALIAVG